MKKIKILIYIIIAISLFLIIFDVYNGETGLTTDGAYYLQISKNLFRGKGYTIAEQKHTVFPPGYPLIIGVFAFIFKDYSLSAQIVSILAFLGSAILLYDVLRKNIRNDILIILSMTIFLFNRTLINMSNLVLSGSFYIFLMMVNIKLMFIILKSKKFSYRYFLLIGLVNGYMYLTRPEGVVVFILNFIVLFILILKQYIKIYKPLLLCFAFFILSFPYIYFLHSATNKWLLSGKTMNFVQLEVIENRSDEYLWEKRGYKLLEDGKNVMIDAAASSDFKPVEYILANKGNIASRILINLFDYVKIVFAAFGLWAAFLFFIFKFRNNFVILYLALLIFGSMYILLFRATEYWIYFMPVFLILLTLITDYIVESRRINEWVCIFFIISGILLNFYVGRDNYKKIFQKRNKYMIEKIAGDWIKNSIPQHEILIVRKPFVPYFSAHEWLRIPWFTESDDFIDYMKRNNLKYFIISKYERSTRPFLKKDEQTGDIKKYAEIIKEFNYENDNVTFMKIRSDFHN